MVGKRRVFAIAGFVLIGFAAAFIIASFASPYWVESNKSVSPSGFERMGLWEVCFDDYYPLNRPVTNRRYQGCWQAISYEMRDLYDHFFPTWFQAMQVMVTLATIQIVACVFLNIIYFIRCCPGRWERYLVFISAVMAFIAALFLFISAIMFGVHVDTDRYWLPQPDSTYLSWAFGFCILAAILSLLAAMCQMTDFVLLRMESEPYDRHVETASRRSARYSAPPPQYDLAVKSYDRDVKTVPPSHQNDGYSPPQPDSWHDGKKSYNKNSGAAPPPRQSGRYSDSEDDVKKPHDGGPNSGQPARQKGRNSKPQYDDEPKSLDRNPSSGRHSHESGLSSESEASDDKPYENETRSYDRRSKSGTERPSRHSTRHSEPPPEYDDDLRPSDRPRERSARRSARRSEPRYDDDTRPSDRHSNTSHHSRQNPRYSESHSRDYETRSHSRHRDASPSSSRRNTRHSESQPRTDESKLYNRRSSRGRSPSRQNSRHSESQSQHERSRQRY